MLAPPTASSATRDLHESARYRLETTHWETNPPKHPPLTKANDNNDHCCRWHPTLHSPPPPGCAGARSRAAATWTQRDAHVAALRQAEEEGALAQVRHHEPPQPGPAAATGHPAPPSTHRRFWAVPAQARPTAIAAVPRTICNTAAVLCLRLPPRLHHGRWPDLGRAPGGTPCRTGCRGPGSPAP